MSKLFRISIFCPDKVGLISAVTGKLFDLGINLGDTNFAVLGTGAEYTAVCSIPDSLVEDDIKDQLAFLPELEAAEIRVTPFNLPVSHAATANITHRILIEGGDNPGLVARLTEVFVEFQANIVRLNTELILREPTNQYRIDIQVYIPEVSVSRCIAIIENTASTLQMRCHVESRIESSH